MGDPLGPHPRLADLVVEWFGEPQTGDVRMNCDVCSYRVRLPGFEERVGTPLSLAPPEAGRRTRGWRPGGRPTRPWRRRRSGARGRGGLRAAPRAPDPSRDDHAGPAIEVRGLAHRWPDGTDGLAGVDLTVAAGERLAVLGANGSGKTTLALHLVGALERDAGLGAVAGRPVVREHLAEVRRRVGLVFQDPDDQLLCRPWPPTWPCPGQPGPAGRGGRGPGGRRPRRRGPHRRRRAGAPST